MTSVIGLDVGRNGVKVYTGTRMFNFPSIVGEWNVRKLVTDYGEKGFELEYGGKRKFIGLLAQYESRRQRRMMTDSKITEDTLALALTALHHTELTDISVVTGLPVDQHDNERKAALRELLLGDRNGVWNVSVNGINRTFRITDVKVAVEGGAAFWSAPKDGLVRLIDAGSKTVNYVTMRDRRYVFLNSGTLPFGFNTERLDGRERKEADINEFAAQVAGELGAVDWTADDIVMVSGGRAQELAVALRSYFPKAEPVPNPLYANAIGYFRAGKASK